MKITVEMLFYRLSLLYPLQTEHFGRLGLEVKKICTFQEEGSIHDCLYIVQTIKKIQTIQGKAPMMLLICEPGTLLSDLPETCSYAVLEQKHSVEDILTVLFEICSKLMCWNARFLEAALHQENTKEYMSWGREMLEWEYAVIDKDFVNLYQTPNYKRYTGRNFDRVPPDIEQHLLMQPSFHAVAEQKGSFYYYEEVNNFNLLCQNVFMDGQYFARVVMYIGREGCTVPAGAQEIFENFVGHLEEFVNHNRFLFERPVKDQLHSLVKALAENKKPVISRRSAVLKKVGWKNQDTYAVIRLHFYEEEGWNTQLATTLPYLIRELERQWKDSCAIVHDQSIIWVINVSLSNMDKDIHNFHQQAAFFVRDHVCNAGMSPCFRDFTLIPYAVRAADAALRIGQAKQPHFWYFLFDDYRREYMLEKMQEELPVSMLCHPAIEQLIEYDKSHGTELAKTLQTYLQCSLNMTSAAEKLYIHRTSFCRRMNHIRKLVNIDISDPNTILELQLSYQLYNI